MKCISDNSVTCFLFCFVFFNPITVIKYCILSPQAIQHIERTQERRASAEEEQRRVVIVSPAHAAMDMACSDTDTDTEGEDCSMN